MKKVIVIALGVLIGVTGVLAICAHLALSTAMRGSLQMPQHIWTVSAKNCRMRRQPVSGSARSRRTRRSAKQWMISCMTSMVKKTRAVKKIII